MLLRVGLQGNGLRGSPPLPERFVEDVEASRRRMVRGRDEMGQALAGAKQEWVARIQSNSLGRGSGGGGGGGGTTTTVARGPRMVEARSLGRAAVPLAERFVEGKALLEDFNLKNRAAMGAAGVAARASWEARVASQGVGPVATEASAAPSMLASWVPPPHKPGERFVEHGSAVANYSLHARQAMAAAHLEARGDWDRRQQGAGGGAATTSPHGTSM
jgi:hypothetical protein